MRIVFWSAVALVAWVYVGYPLLVAAWAALRPRAWRRAEYLPPVSIVIAARNEEARLPGRLENLLALDYPLDRLEVVVVSDGSTDRTAAIVEVLARFSRADVRLIERPAEGKAAALNAGVAAARHDVLVFADARQRFARGALKALVSSFADPDVGVVSGELVLDCEAGHTDSTAADGVGAYWRYEKWMRMKETCIGSMLGATGAIYAMRRRAWQPLPTGTILDDVLAPMRAVLAGWRAVFEPAARAFDVTAPDTKTEQRRKTRTLAGNWQILALEPRLLLPWANPVWLQYVSQKVGRLLVPFALVAAVGSAFALAPASRIAMIALVAQAVFYALAGYGAWLDRTAESTRTPTGDRRRDVVSA
jgi:cellulose synthase/poly-beta-1,6-N-acetylglucosamine synthase-like glycosyltransferase